MKIKKHPGFLGLVIGVVLFAAVAAMAEDSKALLDALIRKGILSDEDIQKISAEVGQSQTAQDVQTSGDKYIRKLTLSGRFQSQYVGLGTSIDGATANPARTEHFLLRRIYVGMNVQFGDGLSGVLNYDLANSSFDKAFIQWKRSDLFALDVGFEKAPFGYEELTSSGNLRAIERSVITNYIDGGNNGRRLGASSYRTGLFISGAANGFFYNAALTNPEGNPYGGDGGTNAVTVNGLGGVGTTGTATTNKLAYYGTAGYGGKFKNGSYRFGYETGFLPNQGGPGATIGGGNNIMLSGFFADVTVGPFNLQGEWEQAKVDWGASAGVSATPNGYWIQPAYKLTSEWEAVVRYSFVNSDHRGVALSDGVRSAPSGGTMNTLNEWYLGANWYLKGNDVKLQFGYILGESDNTVSGAKAKAQTQGVRSQMQVNF